MEDQCSSRDALDPFPEFEKRDGGHLGEEVSEPIGKKVKTRDLKSVLQAEGMDIHRPTKAMKATGKLSNVDKVREAGIHNLGAESGLIDADRSFQGVDRSSRMLDLNSEACLYDNLACNDPLACSKNAEKCSSNPEPGTGCADKGRSVMGGLNLNAEDVCSSAINDPFHPYTFHRQLKYGDAFECGSSTGPVEEKDPMQKWKEMKQNGFLSPSYGGIPVGIPTPKQQGRKSKNDALKKRIELAKKEQVERFTKLAAPTGLLHGLNPGIINHVRNSKQVHSIIKALVRSEEQENRHNRSKQTSQLGGGVREIGDRSKEIERGHSSGAQRPSLSHEVAPFYTTSGKQMHENHFLHCSSMHSGAGPRGGCRDSSNVDRRILAKASFSSKIGKEDIAYKLSSSAYVVSRDSSSEPNFSVDAGSVDSLFVKAANVASQWLQLLHQDIEGRLAALRHSRKRVQVVIKNELPFMLKKEFLTDQENEPYLARAFPYSSNEAATLHEARWCLLFNKMDKALSEEEEKLDRWLNQVKKMSLHCEHGLQHVHHDCGFGLYQMGVENHCRSEMDESEREKAFKAAAASIYSMCKLLLSKDNMT
ncbi:hypothetical protein Dimus_033532 [Dionaea muscipula]